MSNRFQKGSGVYKCLDCGRMTRDTHGEGELQMCYECMKIAELDNALNDGEISETEYDMKVGKLIEQREAKRNGGE